MTRVACQQLAPTLGDLAANADRALAAIQEALEAGAEVVLLPELITSGYKFVSAEEAGTVAIDREHAVLAGWADAARRSGAVIAGGFCERGDDGRIYNTAVIFPAAAAPVFYRKLHLWDEEKLVFTPGDAFPPVVDTPVGRVAIVICYDLEFCELTRSVALEGTQLLLVPTNWPLVPRPDGEHPPEAIIAMAAARSNRMAVACADRAGVERGQAWTQGSAIIGADGWVAARRPDPGLIIADLDLEFARDKQLTPHAHAFGDRRPEFYDAVVTRAPR